MKDNEDVLIVCNPVDAQYILSNNKEFKDILVITEVVPIGELTVVPKEEFLKYLNEGILD